VQYNTPSWGARSGVAMEHRANRSKRLKTDTRQKLCFNGPDNTQSVMRQGIERANQKGGREARDKDNVSTGLTCAEGLDPTREFSFSAAVNVNSHIFKRALTK